eukprot:1550529-Prymnesium_polylepis.2
MAPTSWAAEILCYLMPSVIVWCRPTGGRLCARLLCHQGVKFARQDSSLPGAEGVAGGEVGSADEGRVRLRRGWRMPVRQAKGQESKELKNHKGNGTTRTRAGKTARVHGTGHQWTCMSLGGTITCDYWTCV